MIYLTFNYKLSITIIYINYCLCFPVQILYLGDNLNQVEAFYLIKKRQFYKQKTYRHEKFAEKTLKRRNEKNCRRYEQIHMVLRYRRWILL